MKPHRARVLAMQAIYQEEFQKRFIEDILSYDWIDYKIPDDDSAFARKIILGVKKNFESIDNTIKRLSKNWNIDRIPPVNKAILRISIYQMEFMDIPGKVIIDEAIKLTKEYSDSDTTRYINGLLDSRFKEVYKNGEVYEKKSDPVNNRGH